MTTVHSFEFYARYWGLEAAGNVFVASPANPRTEADWDEDSWLVLTLVKVLCVKAPNWYPVLGQVSLVLARILFGQFSKNPAPSYVMKLSPLPYI